MHNATGVCFRPGCPDISFKCRQMSSEHISRTESGREKQGERERGTEKNERWKESERKTMKERATRKERERERERERFKRGLGERQVGNEL